MNWVEIVGMVGTAILMVSATFKTQTFNGSLFMRIFNIVGCAIFITYGAILPAYSTMALNIFLIIIHTVHLVILLATKKKNQEVPAKENTV